MSESKVHNSRLVTGRSSNESLVSSPKGPPPEPSEPVPDLPEKFQGKSIHDVVGMYTELESTLGKQGKELGELRRMMQQQPQAKPERVDVFDDPEKAVSQIVDQKIAPVVAQSFESALDKRFPDWKETVVTSDFMDWAQRSKSRRMALAAAQQWDLESAVDLMEQWSEKQSAKEGAKEEAEQAINQDRKLRRSITESGSATTRTKGKVYSRRWVQDLQTNDPAGYRRELPDIVRAYREGRYTD